MYQLGGILFLMRGLPDFEAWLRLKDLCSRVSDVFNYRVKEFSFCPPQTTAMTVAENIIL